MAGRGERDREVRPPTGARRLSPRVLGIVTLAAVIALVAGCTTTVQGKGALAEDAAPTADPTGTSDPTGDPSGTSEPTQDPNMPTEPEGNYPDSNEEFEVFLIDQAPGGLQQVPNGQTFEGLPSGPVTIDDTAAQFGGMEEQEALDWLESMGYWQGYRRLWGTESKFIYSIVDQFLINDGAAEFVDSFAPSYADRLGTSSEEIPDYPGCVVAAGADSDAGGRPTAFASCYKKVWSIDIQAVAASPDEAKSLAVEMAKVQYSKLP